MTPDAKLQKVRADIAQQKGLIAGLDIGKPSRADVLEAIRDFVAGAAGQYEIGPAFRDIANGHGAEAILRSLFIVTSASGARINLAPLLATIAPAALIEQLSAAVGQHIPDGRPSASERTQQRADSVAALATLERAEERLCREIERAGGEVTRRGDAPPDVVLASDGALK